VKIVPPQQIIEILDHLELLRAQKRVPLGILSYSPDDDSFRLNVFREQNKGEIDALLLKINLHATDCS
jgi:hypothetical protein